MANQLYEEEYIVSGQANFIVTIGGRKFKISVTDYIF